MKKTKKCDCGSLVSLSFKKAVLRDVYSDFELIEMWTWLCQDCGQVWATDAKAPKRI